MKSTDKLQSREMPLGRGFRDILSKSSASAAGFHANSEWLTCPERMRLKSLGVEKRPSEETQTELNALDFGTLIHELLALRVLHGHEATVRELDSWRGEIGDQSYMQAALILGVYETTFPLATEALDVIAVEAEVITDIRMGENDEHPCFRTVRYDGVAYASTPGGSKELFSLERKTMSRSGYNSLSPYYPQGMTQVALWNANPALVTKYGPMKGVIYESIVKTKLPSMDRQAVYFTMRQQKMAVEYLRYSENQMVRYAQAKDGSFPRMLHACWGRFAPCPYMSLCHDEIVGDYQLKDGSPLI